MSVVGHEVLYRKNGVECRGHVLAKMDTLTTIWDPTTDKEWPGVKFLIRPKDGGPDFWTVTYPDTEENQ